MEGGNGGIVLDKWKESPKTHQDLIETLRSKDIGLNQAAKKVEDHFLGDTDS